MFTPLRKQALLCADLEKSCTDEDLHSLFVDTIDREFYHAVLLPLLLQPYAFLKEGLLLINISCKAPRMFPMPLPYTPASY